jgi:hypothetical protein
MALKKKIFTPWSSLDNMLGKLPTWWPEDQQQRIASYEKYDQLYWNDPTQYAIRVLEDEQPLYIPNARTIVDTTANYLLKGLTISGMKGNNQVVWDDFCKREKFFSKFHTNKVAGICRGDWAFHITADPMKPEGTRISINTLHPGQVWKVENPDDPDDIIRIHLVTQWIDPDDPEKKIKIRKLTYEKVMIGQKQRIGREEAIWQLEPAWYASEPKPVKLKTILAPALLDESIDQFPVYWFKNIDWEGQVHYGSSELRGLEFLDWAVSQGATDTQAALALEGLGVFATDGGRPVNDEGDEEDWEVAPGKVMEVPAGAYFRRVDGVTSITPMMDQIKYLEGKMYETSALTDVALGKVDVQVAQSGIALAIKFMPTLAKIEQRDIAGVETTVQMLFDLKKWFAAYEGVAIAEDFEVNIATNKLPKNATEVLNELNNMFDRKIISRKYYREQVLVLGYNIPKNMDKEILGEAKVAAEIAALAAPPGLQQNAQDAAAGKRVITTADGGNNSIIDNSGNKSNNQSRPNESSGTEAK